MRNVTSWPVWARHLVLMVSAVILSWVISPAGGWRGLLTAVCASTLAYITPLVREYGWGSDAPPSASTGPGDGL